MVFEPRLIIQVPGGSALERRLKDDPPSRVASGDVVVEGGPTDPSGNLEPPPAGEVVLSFPAPETISREPDEVRRVLREAGTGPEPLVVVIEAAEELTDADLGLVLEAAAHAPRPVILRVIREA
jgi:hypothetical protein